MYSIGCSTSGIKHKAARNQSRVKLDQQDQLKRLLRECTCELSLVKSGAPYMSRFVPDTTLSPARLGTTEAEINSLPEVFGDCSHLRETDSGPFD